MNDQEYICKGIELADGWDLTHIYAGEDIAAYNPNGKEYPEASFVLQTPSQSGNDALAAQLVRQVDAIDGCEVIVDPYVVHVFVAYKTGVKRAIGTGHSDDRTMNTIKAIVDSGVLK